MFCFLLSLVGTLAVALKSLSFITQVGRYGKIIVVIVGVLILTLLNDRATAGYVLFGPIGLLPAELLGISLFCFAVNFRRDKQSIWTLVAALSFLCAIISGVSGGLTLNMHPW